jgi:hypothetical protein
LKKSAWEDPFRALLIRSSESIRTTTTCIYACLNSKTVSLTQEDITVQISDGRLYVGDEKVQYRKKLTRIIETMLDFFKRRDLTGLRIHPSVKEVDLDDLLGFVRLLIYSAEKDDPAGWLLRKTEETKNSWYHRESWA